jgi:hypothetical protein
MQHLLINILLVGERQLQRAARFNVKTHEPLHAINGAVNTIANSATAAGEIEQPLFCSLTLA